MSDGTNTPFPSADSMIGPASRGRNNLMNRRNFIAALGGTVATWPLAAHAQQRPKVLRVGVVVKENTATSFLRVVIRRRFAELGYVEGKNLIIERVLIPNFSREALERGHREVARRRIDIVVALGSELILRSALAAAGTTPIVVIAVGFDPVARGYAKGYREPGGNVTGVYSPEGKLTEKRLQLITETLPNLKALTVFWNDLSAKHWRTAQKAAGRSKLDLFGVKFTNVPYDYERGFASVPARYRGGLLVLASQAFRFPTHHHLTGFALQHRLPSFYAFPTFIRDGGLMSYGVNMVALFRRGIDYVDLIAKGADPATLPIEAATKFDFAVNLKTAKALGIKLPRSILLRATEVIE